MTDSGQAIVHQQRRLDLYIMLLLKPAVARLKRVGYLSPAYIRLMRSMVAGISSTTRKSSMAFTNIASSEAAHQRGASG